jgi:hypothetical protein
VAAPVKGWQRRQDAAFAVDGPIVGTAAAAEKFLDRVGIALRYNATANLPLASLQRAFAGDLSRRSSTAAKADATRAIALTNHLLGTMTGIETHVIAGRVAVVHRRVMPALYALVRRGRAIDDLDGLSLNARTALGLLQQRKEVSAGDVRHRLGLRPDPRNDPAYAALGELMRVLLVDRGPFEIPKNGIAYLPPEGYPYHLFHEAHGDVIPAAKKLSVDAAADAFLSAYLQAAVFARARKLATLFKIFLSPAEIDASLARLVDGGRVAVEKVGSAAYHVLAGRD